MQFVLPYVYFICVLSEILVCCLNLCSSFVPFLHGSLSQWVNSLKNKIKKSSCIPPFWKSVSFSRGVKNSPFHSLNIWQGNTVPLEIRASVLLLFRLTVSWLFSSLPLFLLERRADLNMYFKINFLLLHFHKLQENEDGTARFIRGERGWQGDPCLLCQNWKM